MEWIDVTEKPAHKTLVLCKRKSGAILPAIYYDNPSFKGFFKFTTHYAYHKKKDNVYNKVEVIEITKVKEWLPFPA